MLFTKNIDDITHEDLEALIVGAVLENDMIEFKGDLPAKKGLDKWHQNNDSIGDYARNELLAEIVAFANQFGGTLVLGMEETEGTPAAAKSLYSIPRCGDLASRLEQAAGSCIEPQIPGLRFRGVELSDDGSGVVVMQTRRSNMAPHRLIPTKECYTRRGERTERMTMREIRDLVLSTRSLSEYIDHRFNESLGHFRNLVDQAVPQMGGIRAFSVSATPLDPDRVYLDTMKELRRPEVLSEVIGRIEGGQPVEGNFPHAYLRWKPILRGAVGIAEAEPSGDYQLRLEIYNNGDVRLQLQVRDGWAANQFYPSWILFCVTNAFLVVSRLKETLGESGLEFGMQCHWLSRDAGPVVLRNWHSSDYGFRSQQREMPEEIVYPRYSTSGDLTSLLNTFVRDMWNSVGVESDQLRIWTTPE